MDDLMNLIHERRSIRKYKQDPIPGEAMNAVLDAVRWAPSWANTQCWELIVITDPEIRRQLQETVRSSNPSHAALVEAPVLLALCGELKRAGFYRGNVTTKFGDWFLFDLGIAMQNIALAAHAQGLGTVVVGLMDHDAARAILKVPEGYELAALVPLGYPAETPPAPPRREISTFVHHEMF